MHFIEGLFGVSPDGGSGTLECYLALLPLVLLAFAVLLRRDWDQRRISLPSGYHHSSHSQ
jgi:MYXO-CTERM domain-containing protein